MEMKPRNVRVPELYGDFWFNGEPISLRAHQGKVILLDFWDYASLSCLRTLPYLKTWHQKYSEFGMLVIGVHTPEFKFGKNPEHVERATRKHGIEYPVVTDNEGFLWGAFGTRSRPTMYLIDRDGFIRYQHEGEGSYDQFERAIQSLLAESGIRGALPDLTGALRETDELGVACHKASMDIHAGYLKGAIGNIEGSNPESTVDYEDHGFYLLGRFYVDGKWMMEREFVRFNGSAEEEGYLSVMYQAAEVAAVLNLEKGSACKIVIEQDGLPLTDDNRGDDVELKDSLSIIFVDTPRLYNIVKNKEFGEHTLKITTTSPHLSVYAFSFVTSAIHDVVPARPLSGGHRN